MHFFVAQSALLVGGFHSVRPKTAELCQNFPWTNGFGRTKEAENVGEVCFFSITVYETCMEIVISIDI
jgi:hypothetical protein